MSFLIFFLVKIKLIKRFTHIYTINKTYTFWGTVSVFFPKKRTYQIHVWLGIDQRRWFVLPSQTLTLNLAWRQTILWSENYCRENKCRAECKCKCRVPENSEVRWEGHIKIHPILFSTVLTAITLELVSVMGVNMS